MWELDYKKAECWRIDAFELWCWRRLLRVPWTARRSNQAILKETSSEYSLEGLRLKTKTPVFWLPDAKSWLIWKDPDAGKDWGQEEKGTTEDKMAGWHHQLDGHGFGWTPGVGDGQGGLVCCSSWGGKESDTTEQLNWTESLVIKIKASGSDRIPVELFQILNHDSVKVLHSICQQIWTTQQWPQDWKRSAFIPIPKKGNTKECSNYQTIVLISHTSKVMLKILQARLQHMWTMNFQMFKLVLEKAEEPEIKLPTSVGSSKKQESSRKISVSALLAMPKPLTVWITINCGTFWKRWEYLICIEKSVCKSGSNS